MVFQPWISLIYRVRQ